MKDPIAHAESLHHDALRCAMKMKKISRCLENEEVDLWQLRQFAFTKGGFINDVLRSRAWHKLIGVDPFHIDKCRSVTHNDMKKIAKIKSDAAALVEHMHPEPMIMDNGCNVDVSGLLEKIGFENKLATVIMSTIYQKKEMKENVKPSRGENSEQLHYYHGFHLIASIVLQVYSKNSRTAVTVLHKIATSHLRELMKSDLNSTVLLLNALFFPLIQRVDRGMHDFLKLCNIDPTVILPWLMTWFISDLDNADAAKRLFDVFLASHLLMPLYFSIAVITHPVNRMEIFNTVHNLGKAKSKIRGLVSKIHYDGSENAEQNSSSPNIPLEDLIGKAISIMKEFPPRSLPEFTKSYDTKVKLSISQISSLFLMVTVPPIFTVAAYAPSDREMQEQARLRTESSSSHKHHLSSEGPFKVVEMLSPNSRVKCEKAIIASGVSIMLDQNNSSSKEKEPSDKRKRDTAEDHSRYVWLGTIFDRIETMSKKKIFVSCRGS